MTDASEPTGNGPVDNRFGGTASAHTVVQAGDVRGGVHVHQPPPPGPSVVPHQLRAAVGHFVNRSGELARLAGLVADGRDEPHGVRVAAITGTAGVGKTSLALHWAHSVRPHFPGGAFYADLHGYGAGSPVSPQDVLGRFLEDLGVPLPQVPSGRERRETLFRSLLADRRMLMVLDNAVDSAQVRPLLPAAPGCLTVVTSRDDLSGLVAQEGALRLEVSTFPTPDAVDLLRAATAGYRARDRRGDLAALAGLCAGLPLALRIAARLFRLLGLHPGGEFGLPAVAALAGGEPPRVRALLDTLVRAHLLERRPAGRHEFHDLLRAYAAERVRQEEDEMDRAELLGRCLAWYLHTAYAAQRAMAPYDRYDLDDRVPAPATALSFDGYRPAYEWYRAESANLVTATRTASDAGFPEIAWRLAVTLRAVYMHQNAFDDWETTARIGLAAALRTGEAPGEAEALDNLGRAAFQALRLDEAEEHHRAALAVRRRIGDRRGTAVSVNALGLLGLRRRELAEARSRFEESAELFGALGDRRWSALIRGNLAETLCELGRGAEAAEIVERALTDFRALGDRFGEGNALFLLSWARRESGEFDAAGLAIQDALAIAADESNPVWRGHWLAEAARVERARENPAEALRLFRESASVQRKLGDTAREAAALAGAGEACRELGRPEEAVKLLRRAVAGFRGVDAPWQLAGALGGLADALDAGTGAGGQEAYEAARAAREEALRLLGPFDSPDDPRAAALVERLGGLLGGGA
ncbi:tetratricopeptide repeat protein [Streptomyces sp. NPDC004539]|uniref:ATP-binding protein n=1 Tax=Streptomyces sp. NPDC004539 TaxID=3154280 RepID=UPI0033B37FDA